MKDAGINLSEMPSLKVKPTKTQEFNNHIYNNSASDEENDDNGNTPNC